LPIPQQIGYKISANNYAVKCQNHRIIFYINVAVFGTMLITKACLTLMYFL